MINLSSVWYISDRDRMFYEIPAYDVNKDCLSYLYTRDGKEDSFLMLLSITSQNSMKLQKDTRSQSDCSLWFELRKLRITFSACHKIFIPPRNFDTLCTEIINPSDFEDLPPKIREALNHRKNLS